MHWMNKLERKFGKYAIKNLIIYILIAYGIGYVLLYAGPYIMQGMATSANIPDILMNPYLLIVLDPERIFHGEVWRLVTWIFTVPNGLSIFTIFTFMFYYWIGRTLEQVWGAFRYNVFIFFGMIVTMLGPIVMYLIYALIGGFDYANSLGWAYTGYGTQYLNYASFLAFALLFPDVQVRFMFLIPIKMKWLGIIDAVWLSFIVGRDIFYAVILQAALGNNLIFVSDAVCIVCSLASFLVYFLATRNYKRISPKEIKRKKVYHKTVKEAQKMGTRHYCAVCGRTEVSNPELTFRFCSKCSGALEYCNDHLFTHEHKH